MAASLAEDNKSWRLPLSWFESGKHQVSVYMDGAQVAHPDAHVVVPHIC